MDNLEEVVVFVNETKREGIPNGSVWVYNDMGQGYNPDILGEDVGCGMAAFKISKDVNLKKAADEIAKSLKGIRILGSGNHFVDLCSPMRVFDKWVKNEWIDFSDFKHNTTDKSQFLILHTDAKTIMDKTPVSFKEADEKMQIAQNFRDKLGNDLAKLIGSKIIEKYGDWTHNSVERKDGKIIYRKGAIKVLSGKIHIFPVSLGNPILFYTVDGNYIPPYNSMPHASGRKVKTGDFKASLESVSEFRKLIYIPEEVKDNSLRAEHPDCFNTLNDFTDEFKLYFNSIGEVNIIAYVGKI